MINQPLGYSPRDAAKVCGISKTTLYRLIASGQLKAVKCGGRTIIRAEALQKFVACLPAAPIGQTARAA